MACCKKKERKTVSDEECSEMDAEPSSTEEEAPGSLNITDEMKRMLNQLYATPPAHMHTEPSLHKMNINKLYSPTLLQCCLDCHSTPLHRPLVLMTRTTTDNTADSAFLIPFKYHLKEVLFMQIFKGFSLFFAFSDCFLLF